MPLFAIFIAIAVGIFFGNVYVGLGLVIALEWLLVRFIPTVLNASLAATITVIAGFIFWGVYRK